MIENVLRWIIRQILNVMLKVFGYGICQGQFPRHIAKVKYMDDSPRSDLLCSECEVYYYKDYWGDEWEENRKHEV